MRKSAIKHNAALVVLSATFCVLLSVLAFVIQLNIEKHLRAKLADSLNTVLNTTKQAIKSWAMHEQNDVMVWANTEKVKVATKQLLSIPSDRQTLLGSPVQAELKKWLEPIIQSKGYHGYFIISPDDISLASRHNENIGTTNLLVKQADFISKIRAGETALSWPLISDIALPGIDGVLREKLPTMFVGAPVFDENRRVIAIFTFRINPHLAFTSVLQQGRIGKTGETYAFNRDAVMISLSRFDDQLRDIGLIENNQQGILNVRLFDPRMNLLKGSNRDSLSTEESLTYMAKQAIETKAGINVDGYRDYRGVEVLGAWIWDDFLNFGIATEIDAEEALELLDYIRNTVVVLTIISIALLILLTVIFILNRYKLMQGEKERAKLQKQVFQSQKLETLNRLTAGVAHNFNNMLTGMLGYSELARTEATKLSENKLVVYLDEVIANGKRASALVKQLLDFGHKKGLGLKPESLHDFLLNSVDVIQATISTEIKIEKSIEELDALVMIDEVELLQVLINLCMNSNIAMKGKGVIVIHAYRQAADNKECQSCLQLIEGENVVLEIKDSGHGIDVENISRLFDPFFTTKDLSEGAGMGLSVVHSIIHEHNGHIQIQSELGVGTTVRLYLPVC